MFNLERSWAKALGVALTRFLLRLYRPRCFENLSESVKKPGFFSRVLWPTSLVEVLIDTTDVTRYEYRGFIFLARLCLQSLDLDFLGRNGIVLIGYTGNSRALS